MTQLVAAVAAFCLVAGLLLVVDGARRVERGAPLARRGSSLASRWDRLGPRRRVLVLGALAAGLVAFVLTGWVVALIAVPALVIGAPALLADPGNRDIEILQALDRWVRLLGATLPTGKSVTDAMRSTSGQAPPLIADRVRLMVARMDDRWSQPDALMALADDLDCPEADAVIAALILSSQRGGTGAAATLAELSASIQNRLRALREIEAERAKPRVVVRQVTLISLVCFVAGLVLSPQFFQPYRSGVGQMVLVGLLASYVLALAALQRMTLPRRRERVLRRTSAPVVGHA